MVNFKLRVQAPVPLNRIRNTARKMVVGKVDILDEYISEDQTTIIWDITCNARKYLKILRNAGRADKMLTEALQKSMRQKKIHNQLLKDHTQDEIDEFKTFLKHGHLKAEMITLGELKELDEAGLTMWERIKKRFKKQPVEA